MLVSCQVQSENAAARAIIAHCDRPVVQHCQPGDNCQAEASPRNFLAAGFIHSVEAREDFPLVGVADAGALVAHGQFSMAGSAANIDGDGAAN